MANHLNTLQLTNQWHSAINGYVYMDTLSLIQIDLKRLSDRNALFIFLIYFFKTVTENDTKLLFYCVKF